jgi:hypothetical protein
MGDGSKDRAAGRATSGELFAALYAAHQVADHWVQTDAQARDKALPGWPGRAACARHVAAMTAVKAAAVTVVALSGRGIRPGRAAAVLAADAATHYWADRRTTLAGLCDRTGKGRFYRLGAPRDGRDDNPVLGTGAYALDQAWHTGWLWAAAVAIAGRA